MPNTPYIYATLSQQVYETGGGIPPTGWEVFITSENLGLTSVYGYYGAAYRNLASNELIIAHRGTALESLNTPGGGADITNDIQLALGHVPDQNAVARQFISNVKDTFRHNIDPITPPTITYTGHSLGAVLAELSAVVENTAAVTFDSPGSREIMENMIAAGTLPADALTRANGLFTCYNAAPNLVNTANNHAGTVNRVYPPYDASSSDVGGVASPASYIAFTAQQHSIDGIQAQFNPQTGQPKQYGTMASWPSGTLTASSGYQHYISYANNPQYWDEHCVLKGITGQDKSDFITGLGGLGTPSDIGVTISADSSVVAVWGATTQADTLNSYGGSPLLSGFEGEDSYNIYADNQGNIGTPSIADRDSKGKLYIRGAQVTGSATPVTNRPTGTTYTLQGADGVYVLTFADNSGGVSAAGPNLQIQKSTDAGTNRVKLENFREGMFGIDFAAPATAEISTVATIYGYTGIPPYLTALSNGNVALIYDCNAQYECKGQIIDSHNRLVGNYFGGTSEFTIPPGAVISPSATGGGSLAWLTGRTDIMLSQFSADGTILRNPEKIRMDIFGLRATGILPYGEGDFKVIFPKNDGRNNDYLQMISGSGVILGSPVSEPGVVHPNTAPQSDSMEPLILFPDGKKMTISLTLVSEDILGFGGEIYDQNNNLIKSYLITTTPWPNTAILNYQGVYVSSDRAMFAWRNNNFFEGIQLQATDSLGNLVGNLLSVDEPCGNMYDSYCYGFSLKADQEGSFIIGLNKIIFTRKGSNLTATPHLISIMLDNQGHQIGNKLSFPFSSTIVYPNFKSSFIKTANNRLTQLLGTSYYNNQLSYSTIDILSFSRDQFFAPIAEATPNLLPDPADTHPILTASSGNVSAGANPTTFRVTAEENAVLTITGMRKDPTTGRAIDQIDLSDFNAYIHYFGDLVITTSTSPTHRRLSSISNATLPLQNITLPAGQTIQVLNTPSLAADYFLGNANRTVQLSSSHPTPSLTTRPSSFQPTRLPTSLPLTSPTLFPTSLPSTPIEQPKDNTIQGRALSFVNNYTWEIAATGAALLV